MVDLGEFVVVCAGEFVRQVDLIVRQNIRDEMRAGLRRELRRSGGGG
jgi:hypothetical protein